MKRLKLLLAILPLFYLTSCIEILEDVTVNENGSGEYMSRADAGEMMSMLMSMGDEKNPEMAEKMKEVKDTTFSLLSTMKEGQTATAEEQELLKNSTIHIKMDLENSVFIAESKHYFSQLADFSRLKAAISSFNKKADNPFSKMLGGGGDDDDDEENPLSGIGNGMGGEGFDISMGANSIVRSLNQEKLDELTKAPGMEEMDDQTKQIFESVKYKTVFHLPRPATVLNSKSVTVSEDRKTVTFDNNLKQVFEEPKEFLFTINY